MSGARAVLLSVLVHAGLAMALAWGLSLAPRPKVVATLDLSSVELSLAETETDMSAPAVPSPSSAATDDAPSPPLPMASEAPLTDEASELPAAMWETPPLPMSDLPVEDPSLPKAFELSEPRASAIAEAAPRQARVEAPPKPKRTIRPDYPRAARQRGEQGNVILEIVVDAKGAVSAVDVVTSSGFVALDNAAVKAVKSALFTPAQVDGEPIASTARLTLSFKLR